MTAKWVRVWINKFLGRARVFSYKDKVAKFYIGNIYFLKDIRKT